MIIPFDPCPTPKVFNERFLEKLHVLNVVSRLLKASGYRVLRESVSDERAAILVDRNPIRFGGSFAGVDIRFQIGGAS